MTHALQPLYVDLNKEIKAILKQNDTEFRINNNNNRSSNEEEIIEMFRDVWVNKIKKDSIIHSFKKTAMSVKFDRSEIKLVKLTEIIMENFEIPSEVKVKYCLI